MLKVVSVPVYSVCILLLSISAAEASCGAAFCPINTQWNTQGVWTEPGWRADLRYEYIPQNQPRAGSDAISIGQIPHHHDEVKTINRNVLATLDYGFASGWGITTSLPVVERNHTHIHNHMGAQLLEQWDFTEIGDVQLLGRYQLNNWDQPYVFGLYFGTKLPTGKFDAANDDGDVAERSLQPGTGTTDALFGFYVRENFLAYKSSVFAQAIAQLPLNERDEYRPGEKLSVDLGYRYDATQRLSLMLQLNSQYKWRDSGLDAEPEDSGSRTLSLSPGIGYGLTKTLQVYGFVQKPLYQHVNGVQLTPDWSAVTGVSLHF
jgi:hypothetical protein